MTYRIVKYATPDPQLTAKISLNLAKAKSEVTGREMTHSKKEEENGPCSDDYNWTTLQGRTLSFIATNNHVTYLNLVP